MPWCRRAATYLNSAHMLIRFREAAERARDNNYRAWLASQEHGQVRGNPPASRLLDASIAQLASEYPEYSALDREQAEINEDAMVHSDWGTYPPYTGPGYTESPVNWEGWHRPHSDYEKDHYWDTTFTGWQIRNLGQTATPEAG